MSRYDTELELMAEGLHPRDIVWLEKRVLALEVALREIDDSGNCACDQTGRSPCDGCIARAVLSEGDASGG